MVKINGKNFKIYDLDTLDIILVRIASEYNTIPKYLYFNDGLPTIEDFKSKKNIQVENLLSLIINSDSDHFTFVLNKIKDKIKQNNLNLYSDILLPFIGFNQTFTDMTKIGMVDSLLLVLEKDLKDNNYFPNKSINVYKLWEDRKEITSKITENIKNNKAENKVNIQQNNLLDSVSSIDYTNFEVETTKFKLFLNIYDISILEVFNLIHLNARAPFASVNNFYKIKKDFIPSTEWDISLKNDIIVKMCQLTDLPNKDKFSTYTDVLISIVANQVILEIELDTGKQNISQVNFIQEVLSLFPTIQDLEVVDLEENNVKGAFYFPNSNLNIYILSDLIMNNSLFNKMMAIDEHDKASKTKDSIYVHFNNNNTGNIAVNITEKISIRGDPTLRGKDINNLFKYGSSYIRVKISYAKDQKSVLLFQELFGKFLSLYYQEFDIIFNYYKKFIPNFGEKKQIKLEKIPELRLKDIAPEVFPSGYTKKCNDKPTIINDEDIEEAKKEGKKIMRYPISENEGFLPRNYICNHAQAPYPGLRENPLGNKDLVPYLPCCFKKDHSEIEGNIYAHYFKGEELKDKSKKQQQDFIITNKFTPFNWWGNLPENINKIFDLFDPRENYTFVRKGMSNPKSSLLECVMEALHKETNILDVPEEKRSKFLNKIRLQLATKEGASSCKQEMYDFTTKEIIDKIKDPNVYLNPEYFTNLLEKYFNCNIYVFNRKNMTLNAQLILPRFLKVYYKEKNNNRNIFIYQHMGSQSDHSKEPRCELIIRWNEKDVESTEYSFNKNSKVSIGVNNIFNKLKLAYNLNTEIKDINFPIFSEKTKLVEQGIDSYGKTRMVRIEYKKELITILTTPIQPLYCKEVNNWVITKVPEDLVVDFCKFLNIKIISQDILEDYAKTYNGILGNVKISIPIEDTIPNTKLKRSEIGINFPEERTSNLQIYNEYKKIARYITNYLFWLYSKYLHESEEKVSLESMQKFKEKYIEIIPDFTYGYVPKEFNMQSGLMQNSKLILKSDESLKRLFYILRVFSRNRYKIENYYKLTSIENYYQDLTDFDEYQFQVILEGENAVDNWINEKTENYKLYDSIQYKMVNPYFFKNNLINNNIYLAQNTFSLENALYISDTWKTKKYNAGYNPQVDKNINIERYLLYSYKNSKSIKGYILGGEPQKNDPIILGYKVNEDVLYTVLLEI